MRIATHLLLLLAGLNLAAQASVPKTTEQEIKPLAQNCPSLRGRYKCQAPFMLSYKKRKRHEMKIIQSERDGISIFLFEARDGDNGFWAVGDGTPHAYASQAAQAWGFEEVDTEANCPKPESLEIKFAVRPGVKTRLTATKKPPALPKRYGMLTLTQTGKRQVQITARAFGMHGGRGMVESTQCELIDDPNEIY